MATPRNTMLGFVSAGVIAGAGALGMTSMARSVEVGEPQPTVARPLPERIEVLSAQGKVKVLSASGQWRPASPGDVMSKPAGVRLRGLGSWAKLERGAVQLLLSHEADAMLNPRGGGLKLYLQKGRALISSGGQSVETVVDELGLRLVGRSYGVWVRDDRTLVAVLGEEVTLERGGEQQTYGPGREVTINKGGLSPTARPAQLAIETRAVNRRGRGYAFSGKTDPSAEVHARTSRGYERVRLSADGSFEASISSDKVERGEIIAHDTAGRFAEPGLPASTAGSLADSVRAFKPYFEAEPPADVSPSAPKPAPPPPPPAKKPSGGGDEAVKLDWN